MKRISLFFFSVLFILNSCSVFHYLNEKNDSGESEFFGVYYEDRLLKNNQTVKLGDLNIGDAAELNINIRSRHKDDVRFVFSIEGHDAGKLSFDEEQETVLKEGRDNNFIFIFSSPKIGINEFDIVILLDNGEEIFRIKFSAVVPALPINEMDIFFDGVKLDNGEYLFGSVIKDTAGEIDFKIKNSSSEFIQIFTVSLSGSSFFRLKSEIIDAGLKPGDFISGVLVFNPIITGSNFTAAVTILTDMKDHETVKVVISGSSY